MNELSEQQFIRCEVTGEPRCLHWYQHHESEIKECLEKYKEHIPVAFVLDMPELNQNIYADIINHDCFLGICLECSYPLVQFYGCDSTMSSVDLMIKFTRIKKESLCYN